jgi:hypothetical protein
MNKQRIEVAPTYDLSDFHKAYTMINYPHNTSHLSALQLAWTLEHALQIAGVNGPRRMILRLKTTQRPSGVEGTDGRSVETQSWGT